MGFGRHPAGLMESLDLGLDRSKWRRFFSSIFCGYQAICGLIYNLDANGQLVFDIDAAEICRRIHTLHCLFQCKLRTTMTIAFSTTSNRWTSRYSFEPNAYFHVDQQLVSLPTSDLGHDKRAWRHDVDNTSQQ